MIYFQSFEEVFSALKRRMALIVLITFVGCVISLAVALTRTPVFNAIAVVQIEDAQVAGTNIGAGAEARVSLDARRTVRLIEQRVMARGVLLDIMETYDLYNDIPGLELTERIALMRASVSIRSIMVGEAWQADQAVSGMFIEVNLNDPQKAADVANDLLDRVLAEARTRSVDRARVELDFFNAEETRVRAEITAAEERIAEFKTANADALPSNITVLQGELANLNSTSLTLRQQILSLESSSSRTRPEALERQVTVLEDQISLVESRIAEIDALLTRAPVVERDLVSLERELAQLNEQFTVISRRKTDAEMSQTLEEQRQLARFEVLERAIVPADPISRSKRSIAMLGGVASVLLALGTAFVLEMLNPPIRNAAQMERALGIRPVISVPTIHTHAMPPRKRKGKRSKFGIGVVMALLLGLAALIAKPLAELAGLQVSPRNAQ